ncbi:MAG: hypothetical protein ACLR60_08610 [Clostridium paraputrificum]
MKSENDRFLQYIEEQTKVEFLSQVNIHRKDIELFAEEVGVLVNESDFNLDILNSLLANGIFYLDIYNRFKDIAYGIHPSRFSNKFKVNNYQRKKMIETNFIEVAYYKNEEIYPGRYEKVPFFNPEWYFNTTIDDIEIWRADNIKGYNMKQLKMEV